MSAYNQAQYNLSKFNISSAGQIWAEGASKVTVGFSYAGQTWQAKGNVAVRIDNEASLDRGRIASGAAVERITQQSYVNGYFWLNAAARVAFSTEINPSQEVQALGTSAETWNSVANLSQDVQAIGTVEETFDCEAILSQIVQALGDSGEVFASTADVVILSESVCAFPDLTLKPGQTLVIDAGTYNVILDGANAIHLQSGEWLDNLTRNTQSIVISGTNLRYLDAEILYTERYL